MNHNSICTYNDIVPNCYISQNLGSSSNIHIIAYNGMSFLVGSSPS